MAEQASKPETEPEAGAIGVGSGVGEETPAGEDAPMDPKADLEQLDDSLSAMTDLLLSDGDDDDFDLEGDFAPVGAEAGNESPADVVEQIEQVEAAVSAALDEAEDAAQEDVSESVADAVEATEHGSENRATDEAVESPAVDAATEALEAVAESLESEGAAKTAETPPDAAEETDLQSDFQSESGSESLATEATDPEVEAPPPAAAPEVAEAPAATASVEADAAGETPAPLEAAPAPTTTPAPAPAAETDAAPAEEAVVAEKSETKQPPKIGFKTKAIAIALPIGRVISAKAGDLLARGTEPLAVYLADLPKVMRQSLAWLALWTAFNAGAIWSYLLFFRSTGTEANPALMTHISGDKAAAAGGGEGADGADAEGLDPATALLLNQVRN